MKWWRKVTDFPKAHPILTQTSLFAAFSLLLLLFAQNFHQLLTPNFTDYRKNSHVYSEIAPSQKFDLTKRLGVYDSNFYLFMADQLSQHGKWQNDPRDERALGSMAFAFAPLYPIVLALVNVTIQNIAVTAFIVNFILALTAFAVFFWVIKKWFGRKLATRAVWLMALAPPAIFLHLYFSESLTIILLSLLLHGYKARNHWLVATMTGLLAVTRFATWLLIPLAIWWLIKWLHSRKMKLPELILCVVIILAPLIVWWLLSWAWTGNADFIITIKQQWANVPLGIVYSITHFFGLAPHLFHSSMVDTIVIIFSGVLLWLSRHKLPRSWWWVAFCLWTFPVLTTDTMSGLRYQLVLLPLYVYVAKYVRREWLLVLLVLLAVLQFLLSIVAVNYFWIG